MINGAFSFQWYLWQHKAVVRLVRPNSSWISIYVIACDGPPLTSTSPHQSSSAACSSGKLVYQRSHPSTPPPYCCQHHHHLPPSPFNQARGYNASLALTSDQRRGHGGESGSQSWAHPLQLLFLSVAAGRRDSIKSSVYSAQRLHQGPFSGAHLTTSPRALTKKPYSYPGGPHSPLYLWWRLPITACSTHFYFCTTRVTIITKTKIKRERGRKTKGKACRRMREDRTLTCKAAPSRVCGQTLQTLPHMCTARLRTKRTPDPQNTPTAAKVMELQNQKGEKDHKHTKTDNITHTTFVLVHHKQSVVPTASPVVSEETSYLLKPNVMIIAFLVFLTCSWCIFYDDGGHM